MTKVTIDRALIEQAIDVINSECGYGGSNSYEPRAIAEALRAALAEPAVEPFGYFRAEPFGWTDCAPTDEGAKALYEAPPPARPAVEPYAWVYVNKYGVDSVPAAREWCESMISGHGGSMFPLYTAPPPAAEPAVEPVAKHCMPHGWVINWPHPNGGTRPVYHPSSIQPKFGDMKPTMYPVYTSPPPPPPAEPARTSQDVCTVPLLSDEEVAQCIKDASKGSAINRDGSTSQRIVRSAEQLVRRKAGL